MKASMVVGEVMQTDVCVIGAGPGGYVCALRLAQLGLSVTLIERDEVGGICLNWGCIPTKALLHGAYLINKIKHAESMGIDVGEPKTNFGKMIARSRSVSKNLTGGIGMLLKRANVKLLKGEATLLDKQTCSVIMQGGNQTIKARAFVLATGARARILPTLVPNGTNVWTYMDALMPKTGLPKNMLVVGSGAIGIEFAYLYQSLGTKVSLIEASDKIAPLEDNDVSDLLNKSFRAQGIEILTKCRVLSSQTDESGVTVKWEENGNKDEILKPVERKFDIVLSAVGVVANVEGLNLNSVGVVIERGTIVIDASCRTNIDTIYAIGDVSGGPMLAHKASHQGVHAAEAIAQQLASNSKVIAKSVAARKMVVPSCTYCMPQIASVGVTEQAVRSTGRNVLVGKFPLIGNGKSVASADTNGFVKTITDAETGEILGVHIVGPDATEMIHSMVISMQHELTFDEIEGSIFPHPTVSESIHEAFLATQGRALHI